MRSFFYFYFFVVDIFLKYSAFSVFDVNRLGADIFSLGDSVTTRQALAMLIRADDCDQFTLQIAYSTRFYVFTDIQQTRV